MTCRRRRAPPGGDPLDLVNATGTEDDVMPGPGADLDEADDSGDDASGRTMEVDSDPAPEGGATLDPPGTDAPDRRPASTRCRDRGSNVQVPGEPAATWSPAPTRCRTCPAPPRPNPGLSEPS